MQRPGSTDDSIRPPGSRLLHLIDHGASRPVVAWTLVLLDAAWVVYSITVGFPTRVETVFQTLVAAATVAMVFVIQHTQSRQQLVTQRKLDEILRSLPHADNTLIALEEGSDHQLASVHADHREVRDAALTPPE